MYVHIGRSVLGLLIDRVPLTSEKKAHKVLHLCQRFKLKEQAKCVCRVLAVRFIKAGRMGAALEWAVGAKDTRLICHIAERYMTDYQNAGRMRDLRVLRTLDQDMFLSTDLTFLGRYCEFVTLFEQERFTEAGSLLVELLSAEVVPKKFWLTLLTDALPLLDLTDMIALTKEQTEILSMYLEDLLRSCDKVISEDMMDQVGVISLALSHSVSNSFH
jgi:nuclear pore complex protein Nup85